MKLLITVQGIQYEVDVEVLDDSVKAPASSTPTATPAAHRAVPATPAPLPTRKKSVAPAKGGGRSVTSPLAGNVFKVEVRPGQVIKTNDVLLILEAMKMETPIKSPVDATIKSVNVSPGDSVTAGQVLVEFE